MDITLSQEDPKYLDELSRYNRLFRQKQAVLRDWQSTGRGDEHLLRVLTEQLHPLNLNISKRRRQWTAQMTDLFIDHYRFISGGHEIPSLEYRSGWLNGFDLKSTPVREVAPDAASTYIPSKVLNTFQDNEILSVSVENILNNMQSAPEPNSMDRILQQEKRSGRCLWGIHRDDLQFFLNGHPLKPHASQGQQKTYVISLKLAQADLIRQATRTLPLLLLDDVFEKLDEQRIEALLERVSSHPDQQIFLTHTEEERVRAMLGIKADAGYIAL